MSDAPLTDTHPDGAPQPAAFQQYVPLTLSYARLKLGEPPQPVTETRHLIYTHFAYRKLAEVLGIDLAEMGKRQRSLRKRIADLTRQHGRKAADRMLAAEMREGGAASMLGKVADLDVDDLQQVAALAWAAMITEDPAMTVEGVLQMITVQNQTDVLIATVQAMNLYMHGEAAAKVDYAAVKAEIEAGIKGDVPDDAVEDALGVEGGADEQEAAAVRGARSEGHADASDGGSDDDPEGADDGDPGNASAA